MGTVKSAVFPQSAPLHRECPNCGLIAWCLRANLAWHDSQRFNERIEHRRQIRRNDHLHHAGSALTSLYAINLGFLKASLVDSDGREQITGFNMAGELVGMEAVGEDRHQCDLTALEDSRVCGIHYSEFQDLARQIPALQHHFHQALGAEIARVQGNMLLLGTMRAEERVAVFLLNLSKRFYARGYSRTHFRMPMSRQEIGNHLGLKLETVSRVLSRFDKKQFIVANNKEIEIKSHLRLQQLIGDYETQGSSLSTQFRKLTGHALA